jgi:hypothetical protein
MSEHTDGRAALSATPARCERLLSLIVSVLRTSPCASDSVLPQQVGAVWAGAAAASGLICNLMLDKRMRVHLRTFGRAATALSSTGNEFNAPIFAELLPWLSASPVQAPVAAASRAVRRAVERDQRKSDPNTFTVEVDVADTRDRVLAALGNVCLSPIFSIFFHGNSLMCFSFSVDDLTCASLVICCQRCFVSAAAAIAVAVNCHIRLH